MVRLRAIPRLRLRRQAVVAAFAFERDARHALTLVDAAGDIDARFCMHQVVNEHGGVELVMLEARASKSNDAQRIEILMQGAGGIMVAPGSLTAAEQSRGRRSGGRRARPVQPHAPAASS